MLEEFDTQHDVGIVESAVGVAEPGVQTGDQVGGIALMDRCGAAGGRPEIRNGGEALIVHPHLLGSIDGGGRGFCDDHGHRLAGVADLPGDDRLCTMGVPDCGMRV
jgi:hypothetical protein